jgi:hypothetical protein
MVRQHFAEGSAKLSPAKIFKLRTDREFAAPPVEVYTWDNACQPAIRVRPTNFVNLRLAYLVGPAGVVKVLSSDPKTKVSSVLNASALNANPFMTQVKVADLIAKSAGDLAVDPHTAAGAPIEGPPFANKPMPQITGRVFPCQVKLPGMALAGGERECYSDRGKKRRRSEGPVHNSPRVSVLLTTSTSIIRQSLQKPRLNGARDPGRTHSTSYLRANAASKEC